MAINEFNKVKEEGLEQELADIAEHIDDLEGIFLDYGYLQDAHLLIKKYNEYLDILSNELVYDKRKAMRISGRIHNMEKFIEKSEKGRTRFRGYLNRLWESVA